MHLIYRIELAGDRVDHDVVEIGGSIAADALAGEHACLKIDQLGYNRQQHCAASTKAVGRVVAVAAGYAEIIGSGVKEPPQTVNLIMAEAGVKGHLANDIGSLIQGQGGGVVGIVGGAGDVDKTAGAILGGRVSAGQGAVGVEELVRVVEVGDSAFGRRQASSCVKRLGRFDRQADRHQVAEVLDQANLAVPREREAGNIPRVDGHGYVLLERHDTRLIHGDEAPALAYHEIPAIRRVIGCKGLTKAGSPAVALLVIAACARSLKVHLEIGLELRIILLPLGEEREARRARGTLELVLIVVGGIWQHKAPAAEVKLRADIRARSTITFNTGGIDVSA